MRVALSGNGDGSMVVSKMGMVRAHLPGNYFVMPLWDKRLRESEAFLWEREIFHLNSLKMLGAILGSLHLEINVHIDQFVFFFNKIMEFTNSSVYGFPLCLYL